MDRERIVVDVEPVIKRKLERIADYTGKSFKRIVVDFIEEEFYSLESSMKQRQIIKEKSVI